MGFGKVYSIALPYENTNGTFRVFTRSLVLECALLSRLSKLVIFFCSKTCPKDAHIFSHSCTANDRVQVPTDSFPHHSYQILGAPLVRLGHVIYAPPIFRWGANQKPGFSKSAYKGRGPFARESV